MPSPYDIVIPLFAPNGGVRPGARLNSVRALRPCIITDVVGWLYGADESPAGTDGVRVDVKVNSVSILSAPLRILPGVLHSKIAGTPQPVIASPNLALMDEIAPEVLAYGVGAHGLVVALITSTVD